MEVGILTNYYKQWRVRISKTTHSEIKLSDLNRDLGQHKIILLA